jgi:hypothetical protein
MPCRICQEISFTEPVQYEDGFDFASVIYPHQPSTKQLAQSAHSCHFCAMIWYTLFSFPHDHDLARDEYPKGPSTPIVLEIVWRKRWVRPGISVGSEFLSEGLIVRCGSSKRVLSASVDFPGTSDMLNIGHGTKDFKRDAQGSPRSVD